MAKELVRRDPFDVFTPFFNLNRTWSRMLDNVPGERHERMLVPAMDVIESEDHLVITAELPGMAKDAVKITIENGVLTLSGEKKFEHEEEHKDFHSMERRYGAFHRSVTLPRQLDADKAEASFENGVVTIRIPRSEEAKPKQLEIK